MGQRLAELEELLKAGHREKAWDALSSALSTIQAEKELEAYFTAAFPLALVYGAEGRARHWIDKFQLRHPGTPRSTALAEVACLHLLWFQKDYEEGLALAERIDWSLVDDVLWAEHLRFFVLTHQSKERLAFSSVRRRLGSLEAPVEIGARLALLLVHFSVKPERISCDRLGAAALAYLRQDNSLASRVREVEVMGRLGVIAARVGKINTAIDRFRRCFDLAARIHAAFPRHVFAEEFARACVRAGKLSEALKILSESPYPESPRCRRDELTIVKRLLCHAEIAIETLNEEHARPLLVRALDLLRSHAHDRLAGETWRLIGRSLASGPGANLQRALAAFGKAERFYAQAGRRATYGMIETIIARGEVLVASGDVTRGVECLEEAVSKCGDSINPALRSSCLALRSRLLLHDAFANPESVYEGILRDLGQITDSTTLFRVLANLYVFSWRLDGASDLTFAHHRQLRGLASTLDNDLFRRLYIRYVRNPVGRRTIRKLFGCEPGELLD